MISGNKGLRLALIRWVQERNDFWKPRAPARSLGDVWGNLRMVVPNLQIETTIRRFL
jgi:hypothetical protein